jgi:excinuclease ABC subunit B
MMISLRPGMNKDRDEVIRELVDIQYTRNDMDFTRGTFRVKGDVLDVLPASTNEDGLRIEFFGDEIDRITEFDPLTGEVKRALSFVAIFPASHYVMQPDKLEKAINEIKAELEERVAYFKSEDKLLEAQRIKERTEFDMEMLRETGMCSGIENYSRVIAGLPPGATPNTLLRFFEDDYLIIVDESHITLPQVRGMYAGDRARKTTLVDYGFRLPSAMDNRPLDFDEFEEEEPDMDFLNEEAEMFEKEEIQETANEIKEKVEETAEEISEKAEEVVENVKKRTRKNKKNS